MKPSQACQNRNRGTDRLARKREKQGECPACGIKTHSVHPITRKKAPLNYVVGQVMLGRCLTCQPVEGPGHPPQIIKPLLTRGVTPSCDNKTTISGLTMDQTIIGRTLSSRHTPLVERTTKTVPVGFSLDKFSSNRKGDAVQRTEANIIQKMIRGSSRMLMDNRINKSDRDLNGFDEIERIPPVFYKNGLPTSSNTENGLEQIEEKIFSYLINDEDTTVETSVNTSDGSIKTSGEAKKNPSCENQTILQVKGKTGRGKKKSAFTKRKVPNHIDQGKEADWFPIPLQQNSQKDNDTLNPAHIPLRLFLTKLQDISFLSVPVSDTAHKPNKQMIVHDTTNRTKKSSSRSAFTKRKVPTHIDQGREADWFPISLQQNSQKDNDTLDPAHIPLRLFLTERQDISFLSVPVSGTVHKPNKQMIVHDNTNQPKKSSSRLEYSYPCLALKLRLLVRALKKKIDKIR